MSSAENLLELRRKEIKQSLYTTQERREDTHPGYDVQEIIYVCQPEVFILR